MRETYRCPDGCEALLTFHEDQLRVEATSREGETIGGFQFARVGADGEVIDLMDDRGEAVSFKLEEANLADAWHGQGITERVMTVVANEISVSPIVDVPMVQGHRSRRLRHHHCI